ncbi:MAG: serine/threonine protein kinase, partial [Undibacterium sp.]|nr:serine/threonine protein kinase [Undibacterium sp.]
MERVATEKIRALRALFEEGLITEQEYGHHKNVILEVEFSPAKLPSKAIVNSPSCTDLCLQVGQEIGQKNRRYRLERLLGQGGMGQVWQASDLGTMAELGQGEMLALKIVLPQLSQSAIHAKLLIEEATLVRQLAHENIVRMYDWGQDTATASHFIIMEYLDGQSLDKHLLEQGICSLERACSLLQPVALALQYAWEKHRLVHRDLKPSNLFLTRHGEIKLLDFGIAARALGVPQTESHGAGTLGYRAPEAGAYQHTLDPTLDVYAVAVMIYQMIHGTLPFADQLQLQHDRREQQTLKPTGLNARQWLVLQSGFAYRWQERPTSVLALLDALLTEPVVIEVSRASPALEEPTLMQDKAQVNSVDLSQLKVQLK